LKVTVIPVTCSSINCFKRRSFKAFVSSRPNTVECLLSIIPTGIVVLAFGLLFIFFLFLSSKVTRGDFLFISGTVFNDGVEVLLFDNKEEIRGLGFNEPLLIIFGIEFIFDVPLEAGLTRILQSIFNFLDF